MICKVEEKGIKAKLLSAQCERSGELSQGKCEVLVKKLSQGKCEVLAKKTIAG
jgi:hypothetical protein